MKWWRLIRNILEARRKIRYYIPPNQAIDHYQAEPKSVFTEAEALNEVPTITKLHSLVSNASNRFDFYITSLGSVLDVLSYKFDYTASAAFADWFVLGYCAYDENLNYIPIAQPPEIEVDTDRIVVVRNIACPFRSIQPVLSAAFEFYRILNQALRNAGAHTFAAFDAGVVATQSEVESLRKLFAEKRRKAGVGGVEFISAPVKFQALSSDLASLRLTELATLLNREICDAYSIDSSLLNDPENKTYNNKSEALKALYTHTLIPAADRFCEAVTNAFQLRGYKYEFSYDVSSVETIISDRMLIWQLLKEGYQLGVVPPEDLKSFILSTTNKETD